MHDQLINQERLLFFIGPIKKSALLGYANMTPESVPQLRLLFDTFTFLSQLYGTNFKSLTNMLFLDVTLN